MFTKNPFSLALQKAQLQVKLLTAQEELFELLAEEEFWPRVAESICNHGDASVAMSENLDSNTEARVHFLTAQINQAKESIYTLNQR